MLAQNRDYDAAEQRYKASLAFTEELGNRARTAQTLSQLGILQTYQGRAADAVRYQLQSLTTRAELGLADAAELDLRMLRAAAHPRAGPNEGHQSAESWHFVADACPAGQLPCLLPSRGHSPLHGCQRKQGLLTGGSGVPDSRGTLPACTLSRQSCR